METIAPNGYASGVIKPKVGGGREYAGAAQITLNPGDHGAGSAFPPRYGLWIYADTPMWLTVGASPPADSTAAAAAGIIVGAGGDTVELYTGGDHVHLTATDVAGAPSFVIVGAV